MIVDGCVWRMATVDRGIGLQCSGVTVAATTLQRCSPLREHPAYPYMRDADNDGIIYES